MKSTIKALGAALAASTILTTGALAQREGSYGNQPQPQQQQPRAEQKSEKPSRGAPTIMIGDRKIKLSTEFAKVYQTTLAAVEANDTATAPAKIAALHAAATTPEEHYLASQVQLKLASVTKNEAEIGAAVDAMIATGVVPPANLPSAYLTQGKVRYNQKKYAEAAASFEKVLQLDPNNQEAKNLIAQSRSVNATPAESVAMLQQTIAQQSAGGAKAPEELYKRAVSTAYKAKLRTTPEISRQWVAAYPNPTNWSDAIRIYRNMNNVDDAGTLDLLRLARAANALKGEADYDRYAYAALTRGYPGEARMVLEEGIKAGAVDPNKSPFKEMIPQAKAKSAGEAATLDSAAKAAIASGTAKAALATGDLLYGYGEYARAAEVYRAALKKPGVDTSMANLHLGMALARAGDKAGATAALQAVSGARTEIAKYWLTYVSTLS